MNNNTPLFQLHETKDYSEFTYYPFNRSIDKKKVAKLKTSISKTGQLINPIIVDQQGKVIDGQHRLQALIDMKMPVWYIIRKVNGSIIKELIEGNNVVDKWKQIDFCKTYAETGNKEYQSILDTHNFWENKMHRNIPFGRIVFAYTTSEGRKFKEGGAVYLKEQGDNIMKVVNEIDKIYENKNALHFNNIRSLRKLQLKNKHFNSDHFIEQCKKKKFNTYSTVEDTLDSMVLVYNYHILNPSKKIKA